MAVEVTGRTGLDEIPQGFGDFTVGADVNELFADGHAHGMDRLCPVFERRLP
jgi:hypothetical protein